MTIFWIGIFVLSLMVLVKGADWFLVSSEKLGIVAGMSRFVVGVVIVGLGTSLPELISSVFAVIQGVPEIVSANAIGSNIANIFLVIGFSVILAKKLVTTKSLIDIELPLFAISTTIFLIAVWDKVITFPEAVILVLTYLLYFIYTMKEGKKDGKTEQEEHKSKKLKFTLRDTGVLLAGLAGLIIGSKYLISSVISLSEIFSISTGVVSLTAVAFGTSLPELLVSGKAALRGNSEIALGNIFGSNAFNLLMVVGLPALFSNIPLDTQTFLIGLPFLLISSVLFIISGISQRMYIWEGLMYILVYIFFIGKLFNLF